MLVRVKPLIGWLSLGSGALLIAVLSLGLVWLLSVLLPKTLRWLWVVLVPFTLAYCLYWSLRIWRGWTVPVVGAWFLAGAVPSAVVLLRKRRPA